MNFKNIFIALSSIILFGAASTFASEVEGTINTGVQTGISGTVVSVPVASPPAGTYTGTQSIRHV